MSACNTCRMPGRCCTGFKLGNGAFGAGLSALEVLIKLASVWHGSNEDGQAVSFIPSTSNAIDETSDIDQPNYFHVQIGLPFLPFWRRDDGSWAFWCPILTRDGRCGDYENRPALCRVYQPKTDPLCAEYEGVPYQTEWEEHNRDAATPE